jgi:hypothetical protein
MFFGLNLNVFEAIKYTIFHSSSHFFSTLNYMNQVVHFRRDVWKRIVLESFDLLQIERKLEIQHDPVSSECVHRIRYA